MALILVTMLIGGSSMPNPSEMTRLEDELSELQQDLDKHWPKAQKESILRQIRELERVLGRKPIPYNGR